MPPVHQALFLYQCYHCRKQTKACPRGVHVVGGELSINIIGEWTASYVRRSYLWKKEKLELAKESGKWREGLLEKVHLHEDLKRERKTRRHLGKSCSRAGVCLIGPQTPRRPVCLRAVNEERVGFLGLHFRAPNQGGACACCWALLLEFKGRPLSLS